MAFCALVIMLVYNAREAKLREPPSRAAEVHAYDVRFRWNIVLATILGIVCFIVLYLAVCLTFDASCYLLARLGLLPATYQVPEDVRLYLSFVALMLSELPNRRLTGTGSANALIAEGLAAGGYDPWLPEKLRDPQGRALVARLLGVGAAETVKGAVLLTRLLDLRSALEETSEVLSGLLDAFVTLFTFGAFSRVVTAAEEASDACTEQAAQGVTFGDEAFAWPQEDLSERGKRNWRTLLAAAALFALIVAAQPVLVFAG